MTGFKYLGGRETTKNAEKNQEAIFQCHALILVQKNKQKTATINRFLTCFIKNNM